MKKPQTQPKKRPKTQQRDPKPFNNTEKNTFFEKLKRKTYAFDIRQLLEYITHSHFEALNHFFNFFSTAVNQSVNRMYQRINRK